MLVAWEALLRAPANAKAVRKAMDRLPPELVKRLADHLPATG